MRPDYSLYYRRPVDARQIALEVPEYDLFISAYTSEDRIERVFSEVRAKRKLWLLHPEYSFEAPHPHGVCVTPSSIDEVEQVNELLRVIGGVDAELRICVDISGFMRHVLVFLIAKLSQLGVKSLTALYSEPQAYSKQEETSFSTTTSGKVRPIRGLAGSMRMQSRDHVLVGVGYDHSLIGEVLNFKDGAAVFPIFAFPSLSPDMYQQSAIRASRSGDNALDDDWINNRRFAPANDPFATAGVVSEIVSGILQKDLLANIYLSPLSTKAQALGFAIYWVLEGKAHGSTTLLLPECVTHSRLTSVGLKRLWMYSIEL